MLVHLLIGDPAGTGNVFLACNEWNKFDHLEMHTYLSTWCSNVFQTLMRDWATASLSLHWFGEYACVVFLIDFVFICGSGFLAEVVSK